MGGHARLRQQQQVSAPQVAPAPLAVEGPAPELEGTGEEASLTPLLDLAGQDADEPDDAPEAAQGTPGRVRHLTASVADDNRTATLGSSRTAGDRRVQGSVQAGIDDDGPVLNVRRSERFQVESDPEDGPSVDNTATSQELGWRDGAVRGAVGSSGQVTGEDGVARGRSDATNVAVGADELRVGRSRERSVRNGDGTDSVRSASGSINAMDGSATGTIGASDRSSSNGRTQRGVQATGTLDMNADGGFDGASGALSARQGAGRVSVTGGITVTCEDPAPAADGGFTVQWTRVRRGGASGGLAHRSRGSATASASVADTDGGVQHFATLAEAEHFAAHAATELPEMAESADAVDEMAVGESRSESLAATGGAAATGNIGLVRLGADASRTETAGRSVERIDEGHAAVEVSTSTLDRSGVTYGASAISMRAGSTQEEERVVRVVFDLDKPAGRAALDQYLAQGTLPSGGEGYEIASTRDATTNGEQFSLSTPVFNGSNSSSVEESEQINGDGSVEEGVTGTSSDEVSVPLLGSSSQSQHFTANTRTAADGTVSTEYSMGADIDSERAGDAAYGLGRSTGTEVEDAEGEASGNWDVECPLSPEQVRAFSTAVRTNVADVGALQFDLDAGAELRRSLIAAEGDEQAEARAIAVFISESGNRGLAWVRQQTGGGRVDLTLEGSQVFQGGEHRRELEARITRYEEQVAAGGAPAAAARGHAHNELAAMRSRMRNLQDPTNYPELGDELRADEVERTQEWIDRLRAVVRSGTEEEVSTEERTAAAETGPLAEDGTRAQAPEEASVDRLTQRLDGLRERAERARGHCGTSHDSAQSQLQLHSERARGSNRPSAREALGQRASGVTGYLGLSSDDSEADSYSRCDRLMNEGLASRQAAEASFDHAEAARARLGDAARTHAFQTDARQASLNYETAVASFYSAKGKFDSIRGQLDAIERRNRAEHPAYFTPR